MWNAMVPEILKVGYFVCLLVTVVSGQFMVDELRDCKRTSTKDTVAECLQNKLPNWKDKFAEGDASISLPPLEPLRLGDLEFIESSPNIEVRCSFSQNSIKRFTDYEDVKLKINYDLKNLSLEVYYENIVIQGKYNMKGTVSILPINGFGSYWVSADGFRIFVNMDFFIRNQHLQLKISKIHFVFEKAVNMRFNNIYAEDPIIGETVNVFLNENGEDIIDEVRPQLTEHVETELNKILNTALNRIALDDIPHAELV